MFIQLDGGNGSEAILSQVKCDCVRGASGRQGYGHRRDNNMIVSE